MQEQTISIFCETPPGTRLRYAAGALFSTLKGCRVSFTDSCHQITESKGIRLAYGSSPSPEIPVIPAAGLLSETGVNNLKPQLNYYEEVPVLYHMESTGTLIPFDIFSATFWLLSRYEEYQPFEPDDHGRFPASQSFLLKHGVLRKPLVDIWRQILLVKIRQAFPDAVFTQQPFRFIPTIDVDSAWAYRHKPFARRIGGIMKAFFKGKIAEAANRILVLSGNRPDPFDTFVTIAEFHRNTVKPIFFFLLGKYNRYNKNQHPCNRHYRSLIISLHHYGSSGIHPSYETADKPAKLAAEIASLRKITGRPVTRSRQHFLRFRLPLSYRNLTNLGVAEEYSMGFAAEPGFRAGTCNPFPFYDIYAEAELPLLIYPLTVMDGTLRDYHSLQPDEATRIIRELADTVKQYNGVFVSLWHNESLDGSERWKGWTSVYSYLVNYCNGLHVSGNGGEPELIKPTENNL